MSTSTTQQPSSSSADLVKAIDALLEPLCRGDEPGLVIGISRQGELLYRRGFGLASIEQGVANTPRTRMRLASTSKHFTALAILLLAEDGKLRIDDAVQQHLPELPTLGAPGPTLRQLMQHTGGWRGHDELWTWANGLNLQPPGTSLAMMARQSELNFEPGSRMIYSNGGYRLLALTVERLSGLSFAEFLRQRIFEPLGMLDSESIPSVLDVREGLAGLYLPAMGPAVAAAGGRARWTRALYPTEFEGSGSLVSTVDDMLVWLAHLRSEHKTVGSAQSWAEMLAPTTLKSGEVSPYGFGLVRHPYRGVEVIHHNGAILGGGSQMITVPAHGLDITIMTNGSAANPAAIAFKLIDLLLAEQLPISAEAAVPRVAASAFPGLLGQRYHEPESGCLMRFGEVAGVLGLSVHGSSVLPLRLRGESSVWLGVVDMATSTFEVELAGVDPAQAPDSLEVRDGGRVLRFRRLPETAPEAAALASQLVGGYRSADLDAGGQIAMEGAMLTLTVQGRHGQLRFRLQPVSDEVLLIVPTDPLLAALANSNVVNLDRAGGRVVGLRIDSVRTRHMRFTRVDQ
ncbi:beta-lactamase family protein [Roseateles sp. DAIF2]|uniref:serine hydrolase domain-containing protein n=1 Tax=Roseateles sp. DAIF2 TaxID=2714952 RepID=UPI0018A2DDC6|nr:serine hydrolase domain-containing protein [Roseateles sp. DAIF2]QPF73467.1 beta-lactamase family protein [Roseateles sp. DAIF2]